LLKPFCNGNSKRQNDEKNEPRTFQSLKNGIWAQHINYRKIWASIHKTQSYHKKKLFLRSFLLSSRQKYKFSLRSVEKERKRSEKKSNTSQLLVTELEFQFSINIIFVGGKRWLWNVNRKYLFDLKWAFHNVLFEKATPAEKCCWQSCWLLPFPLFIIQICCFSIVKTSQKNKPEETGIMARSWLNPFRRHIQNA
jgi:hypothetical protein